MGLGKLFDRSTQYVATNTETGVSDTFIVVDNIAPDWAFGRYQGGMGIPGAWRAAVLISDLLGSVPWHAYRQRGGNPVERLSPTPLLLEQPSPEETRMTTFSSWALDLVWHGNAVGIIAARNPEGWPTAVLPVPADIVSVRRVGPGANAGGLPVGSIEYSIGGQPFAPDDVLHIPGPKAPGDLRGMGVLEQHMSTLNLATEQQRQAASIAKHGVPTGLLKTSNPNATETDLRDAKAGWLRAQQERTIAVLNSTTEFEPLAWEPEKAQMMEARKFTLHELALIFGVPPYFLGVEAGSMTYSNAETQGLDLIKFSLRGHLARFEQVLSLAFPRGTTVKANLDSILRADTLTRYQAHEIALRSGFLERDEVRDLEDRPPLPEDEPAPVLPAEDIEDDSEES